MFDIGWMEMLVIAVVAIVVIGPKDLPKVMHAVGQWMARARAVARTFQDQMEEMARQSGIDEVRKGVNSIGDFDAAKRLQREIDPTGELQGQMKAMTDVGSLSSDASAAPPPSEQVAVDNAQAEAGLVPPAREPAEGAPSSDAADAPEPPLAPGDTAYKGPTP